MLCATIKTEDYNEIHKANRLADLIELRLDLFQPKDIHSLRMACKKPVIYKLMEPKKAYLDSLPDYLDLPYTVANVCFSSLRKDYPSLHLISSFHEDREMPDLSSILTSMQKSDADFYKLVTMARSTLDSLKMLLFVKQHRCIGICMGELGAVTRILAPIFGAPWSYAPISIEHKTAPGQMLLHELKDVYRVRSFSEKTEIFGLIGDPVSRSSSHHTHNFAFSKLGLDAVYVKMNLKKEELSDFFALANRLDFSGLSVTKPLKENVVSFSEERKEDAFNTLKFYEDKIYGCNTDGVGALNVIERRMLVKDKRIVLLGAGGAAIGIAREAKKRGALLTILNRSLEKAEKLAYSVGGKAHPRADFKIVAMGGYDILINCTSLGMEVDDALPVKEEDMLANRLVMDIVCSPYLTPFLNAAQKKGCTLIDGMEMFTQQAVSQFCFWFDKN